MPSQSHRASHRVKLLSINEIAPAHFQMRLEAPELAEIALPGQFVHICTNPNSSGFAVDPLLRRAFSIMSVVTPERNAIDVLFRVEGKGTQALAAARVGDVIDLIGPLGQPFDISAYQLPSGEVRSQADETGVFHVKQRPRDAIVVGGGVGVPPLVYLSQHLAGLDIDVRAIIGARTAEDVIGWHDLSEVCSEVSVTTDDGSRGHHGRVTDLLERLLSLVPNGESKKPEVSPIVYACGPLPMLRAVAQVCAGHAVRCQVSLEENMPCGIGVCNGCVVRAKKPFAGDADRDAPADSEGHSLNQVMGNEWTPYRAYRRVCVEGPACWADEIDWEHQG